MKDRIMRLSDGEEIETELGQKMIMLFDVPNEPYYSPK